MVELKDIKVKVGDILFCNSDGELSRIEESKVIGVAIEDSEYNDKTKTWDVKISFYLSRLEGENNG